MYLYRVRERISQGELARRCGVCTQTINSIENNLQTPTRLTRGKIELVIGTEEQEQEEKQND
jgi:DNA-binding XRE family transcriptional regulator